MGTPADVLDQAVLYMRIYFVGMPVMMLYNFGAAILRAVGDTQRPPVLFAAGRGHQRDIEPGVRHRVPHGGGGRGHPHGDLPVCVRGAGVLVPDQGGGPLPPVPKAPGHQEGQAAGHGEDRPACGHPGLLLLHLQRALPVVHQLLRVHRHGGQHRGQQHRGLYLHRPGRLHPAAISFTGQNLGPES